MIDYCWMTNNSWQFLNLVPWLTLLSKWVGEPDYYHYHPLTMLWTFRLESIKAGVGTMSYDDSLYPSSAVRRQFHHCSFWIEIQLRLLLDCPISRDGPIQNSPASTFRLMQWVGWKYAEWPSDQGKSFKVKSKHRAIAKIAVVIAESKLVKL